MPEAAGPFHHINFSIRKFREAMVFSPRELDRVGKQMRALGIPEE